MNESPTNNPEMRHDPIAIGEILPGVVDEIERAEAIEHQVTGLLDEQLMLIRKIREGGQESLAAAERLRQVNDLLLNQVGDAAQTPYNPDTK